MAFAPVVPVGSEALGDGFEFGGMEISNHVPGFYGRSFRPRQHCQRSLHLRDYEHLLPGVNGADIRELIFKVLRNGLRGPDRHGPGSNVLALFAGAPHPQGREQNEHCEPRHWTLHGFRFHGELLTMVSASAGVSASKTAW